MIGNNSQILSETAEIPVIVEKIVGGIFAAGSKSRIVVNILKNNTAASFFQPLLDHTTDKSITYLACRMSKVLPLLLSVSLFHSLNPSIQQFFLKEHKTSLFLFPARKAMKQELTV